jgi:hypothetical protein
MKIEITRNTVCQQKVVCIGDVINADESEARLLIGLGKAEPFVKPEPEPEPEVENRDDDVKVDNRDPEPQKKRGRPKKKA